MTQTVTPTYVTGSHLVVLATSQCCKFSGGQYRVAKTHKMPYLYLLFPAKELYN